VPFPSVSDPGLDGLETHPVSLRPEVPRNDGSGSLADRRRFPEHASQNVRVQPSTAPPRCRKRMIATAADPAVIPGRVLPGRAKWDVIQAAFWGTRVGTTHVGRPLCDADPRSPRTAAPYHARDCLPRGVTPTYASAFACSFISFFEYQAMRCTSERISITPQVPTYVSLRMRPMATSFLRISASRPKHA